jgi:GNT-I family
LAADEEYFHLALFIIACIVDVLVVQDYVILFEEEVFPTSDFFDFLDQCLDALDSDDSLIGVSAWNDNGKFKLCLSVYF